MQEKCLSTFEMTCNVGRAPRLLLLSFSFHIDLSDSALSVAEESSSSWDGLNDLPC